MKTYTTNFASPSRTRCLASGTRFSARIESCGFTFIEVLFSIVILGVGMIMIAGMLPVAIKQTADSRNDLTAKVVCDSGYAYLRTLAQTHPEAFPETNGKNTVGGGTSFTPKANTPLEQFMEDELMGVDNTDEYTMLGGFGTGPNPTDRRAGRVIPLSFDVVHPDNTYDVADLIANQKYNEENPTNPQRRPNTAEFGLGLHQLTLGDRVVSGEPRFQWFGFYRRDEESNIAKLLIVAMRKQSTEGTDRFGATTTIPQEAINTLNGPFLVPVEIEDSLTESDKVKFLGKVKSPTERNDYDVDVAETGAYLIIAHSPPLRGTAATGDLNRPFRNNGRIFKLGARRADLDSKVVGGGRVWDLAPGYDLAPGGAGPDGIIGTADDLPDGSMNTVQSFDENIDRATAVAQYRVEDDSTPVDVKGTTAWAWIIGKGRVDAASPNPSSFAGPPQDLSVLRVDLPLK